MTGTLLTFWVLALIAVGTAIGVVVHRNPVRCALLLIVNFLSLGVIYLLQSAQLLAVLQILVYAGAIMVLFLFVIMLLNLGGEQALEDPLAGQKWLAVGLSVVLLGGLAWGARTLHGISLPQGQAGIRVAQAQQEGVSQVQIIGFDLFTRYVYPFELTSLLLLVGVIGVMLLTQRRRMAEQQAVSHHGNS